MSAFIYTTALQWKIDFRNKGVLLTFYVVPLIFFGFMGFIFTSINETARETLIQTMTIFAITMGAILGAPSSLVETYGSEIKKAYKVGNIPLWTAAASSFISSFIHLFIVSQIILLISPILFNAPLPQNIPLYYISLILFIKVCLSVGTFLGLLVKSASKLTMAGQLIFLPSIMLSGIMFPANMLPSAFAQVGKAFPATWALKLMTEFNSKNLIPLLIIFIVMLVVCLILLSKMKIEDIKKG